MPYLAMDYGRQEDSGKLWEYVVALEEERRKIHVFQRELPLCLQLVTHAIQTCKQQIGREVLFPGRSDCEAISNEGPMLEEFMPPKRNSCTEDEKPNEKDNESAVKKPDWLRSVQLWSTHDTHPPPPQHEEELREALKPTKLEEAFHIPFSREEKRSRIAGSAGQASTAEASSTDRTTGERNHEKGEQTTHRKDRRCWSSELHRSFLQALQQLGGAHVATPKQIRELMRVDGLTNDEVKSHLQKYRLHKRRPSPTRQGDNFPQPAQFIFVGGIWVPPPEYAAAAAAADAAAGSQQTEVKSAHAAKVYAPTAILPQCKQQSSPVGRLSSGGRSSVRDNNAHSSSSATSTSSHTSTLYPTFCIH